MSRFFFFYFIVCFLGHFIVVLGHLIFHTFSIYFSYKKTFFLLHYDAICYHFCFMKAPSHSVHTVHKRRLMWQYRLESPRANKEPLWRSLFNARRNHRKFITFCFSLINFLHFSRCKILFFIFYFYRQFAYLCFVIISFCLVCLLFISYLLFLILFYISSSLNAHRHHREQPIVAVEAFGVLPGQVSVRGVCPVAVKIQVLVVVGYGCVGKIVCDVL